MRSLSVSKIKRFYLIKQMDRSDFGDTEKLQLMNVNPQMNNDIQMTGIRLRRNRDAILSIGS